MPVEDPRQNTHQWWGTLTIDSSTQGAGSLVAGQKCVFIKTSQDAHFITYGTFIQKIKILSDIGDAEAALENVPEMSLTLKNKIKDELKDSSLPIVEILEIDYSKTTPLTLRLNDLTKNLFQDNDWLTEHASKVGKEDIDIGMTLPGLPRP